MLKKLLLIAAGLALSAPALADGRHHGHHGHDKHHWKHHHHKHHYKHHYHYHHHYARPVVVMPPAPVYYAPPAPVVYAPAPVYRSPEPHGNVSIRLHFPL